MNELLFAMSTDMGIDRFSGETEDSYIYRVLYSALGQWCLHASKNIISGTNGTTKHNQTIVLNDLLDKLTTIFPSVRDKFIDTSNKQVDVPVFIRRVYEETGYLLNDGENRNVTANYARSIVIGEEALFFGIPKGNYTVNGLGVFSNPTEYRISTKEFLIRDELTYEEYFSSCFDPVNFYDRDIDLDELEFFNPLSYKAPSRSWEKHPKTDCTLARKSEFGPYYRVMQISEELQFADEPIESQSTNFTSYEYRRLYFALKAHYGAPLSASFTKLDDTYSTLKLGGQLPNREFYCLLLLSWPRRGAFDKINFLVHNDMLREIIDILKNIGISCEGGAKNE